MSVYALRLRLGATGGFLTVWPVRLPLDRPWTAEVRQDKPAVVTGWDGTYTDAEGVTRPMIDRFRFKRMSKPVMANMASVTLEKADPQEATFAWILDVDALSALPDDVPWNTALSDFSDPRVFGAFLFEVTSANALVANAAKRHAAGLYVYAFFTPTALRVVGQPDGRSSPSAVVRVAEAALGEATTAATVTVAAAPGGVKRLSNYLFTLVL